MVDSNYSDSIAILGIKQESNDIFILNGSKQSWELIDNIISINSFVFNVESIITDSQITGYLMNTNYIKEHLKVMFVYNTSKQIFLITKASLEQEKLHLHLVEIIEELHERLIKIYQYYLVASDATKIPNDTQKLLDIAIAYHYLLLSINTF